MEKGKIVMVVQSGCNKDYRKKSKNLSLNLSKNGCNFSINKISKGYGIDADWALNEWLSHPVTLEYIEVWESMHNICFDNEKFVDICHNALQKHERPSVRALNLDAFVRSVYYDSRMDCVMLNKDMAIDFACWISPSFKCYLSTVLKDQSIVLDGQSVFGSLNREEDFIVSSIQLATHLKNRAKKQLTNKSYMPRLPFNVQNFEYYAGKHLFD